MAMPGMAPMTAPIELEPAGSLGQYVAKGDFPMSGAWKFEVRWDGPAGRGSTSVQYQRSVKIMESRSNQRLWIWIAAAGLRQWWWASRGSC